MLTFEPQPIATFDRAGMSEERPCSRRVVVAQSVASWPRGTVSAGNTRSSLCASPGRRITLTVQFQ